MALRRRARATGLVFWLTALIMTLAPGVGRADVGAGDAPGQAKLSWSAPTARLDGSALEKIAGYKLYVGREPGRYERVVDVGRETRYTFTGLEPGATYFFAVAVYDTDGLESPLSNEVRFVVGGAEPAAGAAVAGAKTDYVIATGQQDGGYFEIGKRLAELLDELGSSARAVESAGSLENLELLADARSAVNVVLSQTDAYHLFASEHPDRIRGLETLSRWGSECVFIVAPRGSALRSDADLRAPVKLALPAPQSGAAVTFANMARLVPALDGVQTVFANSLEAVQDLGSSGAVDAVMLVLHPKARPPAMREVVDDFGRYQLVQITNGDFSGELPDGERVYEHKRITPKPMSEIPLQDTICTRRLILANEDKLDAQRLDRLRSLIDRRWRDVFVGP
jgi:TRAP-type uncharacterized transport system substrate-binding protein